MTTFRKSLAEARKILLIRAPPARAEALPASGRLEDQDHSRYAAYPICCTSAIVSVTQQVVFHADNQMPKTPQ
jgi:hypothetical protein